MPAASRVSPPCRALPRNSILGYAPRLNDEVRLRNVGGARSTSVPAGHSARDRAGDEVGHECAERERDEDQE